MMKIIACLWCWILRRILVSKGSSDLIDGKDGALKLSRVLQQQNRVLDRAETETAKCPGQ